MGSQATPARPRGLPRAAFSKHRTNRFSCLLRRWNPPSRVEPPLLLTQPVLTSRGSSTPRLLQQGPGVIAASNRLGARFATLWQPHSEGDTRLEGFKSFLPLRDGLATTGNNNFLTRLDLVENLPQLGFGFG